MNKSVIGWTSLYPTVYKVSEFTEERKRALIERIRQRKYNFNFTDYQFLPYCCPVYEDKEVCILTKKQFDDAMNNAWNNIPKGARKLPMDVITLPTKKSI